MVLIGDPTGDVLIVAFWRLSTLTLYLTWFSKSSTSTGEVHIIRDRERVQYKYMEEEDYIHSNSTPSSHYYTCSCCIDNKATAIAALLSCSHSLSLNFCSQIMPLFIGINGREEAIDHGTNYAIK